MTDPKIRVSADVSGVQKELQKVQEAALKINQTLSSGEVGIDTKEAKRDLSALEQSSRNLAKLLEQIKDSGEDLADIDFQSVADSLGDATKAAQALDAVLEAVGQSSGMSQTVRNAKQTADHIQRAARAQEVLSREGIKLSRAQADAAKRQYDTWRQSGARGTSRIRNVEFDDWLAGGWRSYSMDERDASRHRSDVLRSVGINTPGGSHPGAAGRRGLNINRLGAAAGALGGMAGSMTGGGDGGLWSGVGSTGGSLIGAGAGALIGGPVGAMLGGVVGMFASRLLGGIGGSLDSGMQRTGEEGGTLSDLRHSLGATRVDFEELRGSVRYFTEGLGLSYNESAKLARTFAHTAGAVENLAVGKEVGSAAGFARGFGMAPEAAAQFFATMRHYGVSGGDRDNRKLALNIAEAVARGGTSPKMDEVLASIQGFVQSSSRASLTQANAEAYASFMSSLTGLSMYGMKGDPGAAASAMNAADAAMRQGGAFGEASKNFSLGLYQRMLPGFTALDQDYLNEQGAFGTIGRAFGRDSAAYRLAQSRGDQAKMDQYDQWVSQGGNRTIMSMQMEALDKQFGRNTDEFRKAIQSHFGVGAGQASALYQAYQNDASLGGLEKSLSGAGVDISKLNTKQIAAMAELANGDDSAIKRQATRLMGLKGADALNRIESEDLQKALKGDDPEKLRKLVLGLTATHDTTRDQGELMRKQQADMSNAMQKLATELIPLAMTIKDGIIELVKWAAPESQFVKNQEAAAAKQRADESRASTLDSGMASLKRQIDDFKVASPEEQGKNAVALHQLKQQRDAAAARGDSKAVAAYDANIANLEKAIRAGSPDGKQDLIDRYNSMAAERNAMTNVAGGSVSPLEGGSTQAPTGQSLPSGRDVSDAEKNQYRNKIVAEAKRQGLNEAETNALLGLVRHESGFNPYAKGKVITNPKSMHYGDSAYGLFQYMGKTSAGWDRTDPEQQIKNGVADFKRRSRQYGINGAIAGHHAGDGALNPDGSLKYDPTDGNQRTSAYVSDIRAKGFKEGAINEEIARRKKEEALSKSGLVLTPEGEKATGMDRKAPGAPGIQGGASSRQQIDINNRVTLYDQNGNERGNSVVQTHVGAPLPTGMMA